MDYVAVARRVENKQAIATRNLGNEFIEVAGGFAAYGGVGAYVNRAAGMGLAVGEEVSDSEVEAVIEFFESKDEETEACIELSPFANDTLTAAVGRHGFVIKNFGNVLVAHLTKTTANASAMKIELPEGVTIERVDPRDDLLVRRYVEIAEAGFAPKGEEASPVSIELTMKSVREIETCDSFFARIGDDIIGVAGSESSDGLTALFGATVIPEWRGRGIQRALMVARILRGIERGSDLASVTTKPGIATERNATRLGFQMAYTRVALRKPRRPRRKVD